MMFEQFQIFDPPIELFVAGGILRDLSREFGILNPKRLQDRKPPDAEHFAHVAERAALARFETLVKQMHSESKLVARLAESKFDLRVLSEGRTEALTASAGRTFPDSGGSGLGQIVARSVCGAPGHRVRNRHYTAKSPPSKTLRQVH